MPFPLIAIAITVDITADTLIPLLMRIAAQQALTQFGAYVFRRARAGIVESKQISRPGNPPRTHTRALPKSIRFAYDDHTPSVVIGPTPLPGKTGTAPAALEAGGSSRVIGRKRGVQVVRTAAVKARPFMGPALVAEQSKLPGQWANSLKGT